MFGKKRTYVVTGAASGIGTATTRYLRAHGGRVITSDLHRADVIANLATAEGRAALVEGVRKLSKGRIDGIVANAGGGPPETSVQLNFFGAVATLEGLRPLLAGSKAPRAVAVSSIASMREPDMALVESCLAGDEPRALIEARKVFDARSRNPSGANGIPSSADAPLALYGNSKYALQRWCRREATKPAWAGAGIALNAVALGFYDTPAAVYILRDANNREAAGRTVPLRGAFPGKPERAAALLAWCVGAENSQTTGQILYADGGVECAARGAAA